LASKQLVGKYKRIQTINDFEIKKMKAFLGHNGPSRIIRGHNS
jgi:hypothetical protein